jgi:hypothetical protein
LFKLKFYMHIDDCVPNNPYFCYNFRCTGLDAIIFGNTITPRRLETQDRFSDCSNSHAQTMYGSNTQFLVLSKWMLVGIPL